MDPRGSGADPVGLAIHRVLETEREAQADIARARVEAEMRLVAARAKALEMSAIADRRIATVRASVDARIARREAAIESAVAALDTTGAPGPADEERVRRAARRLAAALTGEESP